MFTTAFDCLDDKDLLMENQFVKEALLKIDVGQIISFYLQFF